MDVFNEVIESAMNKETAEFDTLGFTEVTVGKK